MKVANLISILILITIVVDFAYGEADRESQDVIKEYALDSKAVYNIPIGNAPTTIAFPSSLSSIDGANISGNPSIKAPVLLSYQEGQYFFSVKADQPNAQAALNVVHNGQTYAFNFFHREDLAPYRTVHLIRQEESVTAELSAPNAPSQAAQKITPTSLLAMLDQAKSYHLVNANYPGQLDEGIEYLIPESAITEYQGFDVKIEEMFRFEGRDTIVFRISLRNKTEEHIFYQPQTASVRVAQNLYYPSIADASGIIPALSESAAFIAITGKPNGKRADLNLKNAFQIVVSRISDPAKLAIP